MKITVNQDKCIQCGMCVNMCQDVFKQDDDTMKVSAINPSESDISLVLSSVESAKESCPVGAIEIGQDDDTMKVSAINPSESNENE